MKFDFREFLRPTPYKLALFLALVIAGGWFGFGVFEPKKGVEVRAYGFPFSYEQRCIEKDISCSGAADCALNARVICLPIQWAALPVALADIAVWYSVACIFVFAYGRMVRK